MSTAVKHHKKHDSLHPYARVPRHENEEDARTAAVTIDDVKESFRPSNFWEERLSVKMHALVSLLGCFAFWGIFAGAFAVLYQDSTNFYPIVVTTQDIVPNLHTPNITTHVTTLNVTNPLLYIGISGLIGGLYCLLTTVLYKPLWDYVARKVITFTPNHWRSLTQAVVIGLLMFAVSMICGVRELMPLVYTTLLFAGMYAAIMWMEFNIMMERPIDIEFKKGTHFLVYYIPAIIALGIWIMFWVLNIYYAYTGLTTVLPFVLGTICVGVIFTFVHVAAPIVFSAIDFDYVWYDMIHTAASVCMIIGIGIAGMVGIVVAAAAS